jgi:hypothetical protein
MRRGTFEHIEYEHRLSSVSSSNFFGHGRRRLSLPLPLGEGGG